MAMDRDGNLAEQPSAARMSKLFSAAANSKESRVKYQTLGHYLTTRKLGRFWPPSPPPMGVESGDGGRVLVSTSNIIP